MGIWKSSPSAATNPAPPGGWYYDKPIPWGLSPRAEAAIDEPEAEEEPEIG
jgi:hypothetical protein